MELARNDQPGRYWQDLLLSQRLRRRKEVILPSPWGEEGPHTDRWMCRREEAEQHRRRPHRQQGGEQNGEKRP